MIIDTHKKYIDFGKYKGERWTRLPIRYLQQLANKGRDFGKMMAEAELKRRGMSIEEIKPDVELSGHAINRASQITDEWKEVGVHSWLVQMANEASLKIIDSEEICHKGYKFCFSVGHHYPVLITMYKIDENTICN
jgi:uncharacterized protein (DUF3820 family)